MLIRSAASASLLALAFFCCTADLHAQERPPMPPLPVMDALDLDRDGKLSPSEIGEAAAHLRSMDRNADGRIDREELAPNTGRGERGGRGNRGGRGGPDFLRMMPIYIALDVDADGELSSEEIDEAKTSLLSIDKDKDGVLAEAELMPSFPGPGGGPERGPGGFGGAAGPRKLPTELEPKDGVARIPDRATFKQLSYQGTEVMIDTQLTGLEFVKFVIADAGTEKPLIYFMNTKTHRAHPMFTRQFGIPSRMGRGMDTEPEAGNAVSMMGVLVYRPLLRSPSGQTGLYTFEFEPNDAYSFALVKLAHDMLCEYAPPVKGNLSYHPLQRAITRAEKERTEYDAAGLPIFLEADTYADIAFLPMHQAESFGRLRLMEQGERPTRRDVVLYRSLPNELPRVAGMLTAARQTPLSHVNLRAVQDNVPNAYLRDAADNPAILSLIGKHVYYRVAADGYELREATQSEVDQYFAALRPHAVQEPIRDLSQKEIRSLDELRFEDSASVGAKAANLAAMRKMDLQQIAVPSGYAIPFRFYDRYMRENSFYGLVKSMMVMPGFKDSPKIREMGLMHLRREIEAGTVSDEMREALAVLVDRFEPGTPLRCRSSTNTEDLPNFSGAGLYESFTHRPDEGGLEKTILQVYASLWTVRAFEEREFFSIDHYKTAMAVLVHPNYDEERANGVAVTDDILYQSAMSGGRRYYVNVQVGEDLVTNPEAESIPDEYLLHPSRAASDTLVQSSNRVADGTRILTSEQLDTLRRALTSMHRDFRRLYGLKLRDQFAIEVEFKITSDGQMAIKQARPWVY